MTATEFTPPPYQTVDEAAAAGTLPDNFPRTIGRSSTVEQIEALTQWSASLEASRREAALVAAIATGVGLRVDVHGWHTEYWLDPEIPAGTIEERWMV